MTNPDLAFANMRLEITHHRVLTAFPKSQHQPYIIKTSSTIKSIQMRPVKRWNFRKADWVTFTELLNTAASQLPSPTSDPNTAYSSWYSAIIATVKKTIPHGCRKALIPTWDSNFQQMYNEFTRAIPGDNTNERADTLKRTLNEQRCRRWESSTASIDFSHSNHQLWQLLNRLTGHAKKTLPCPMSSNAIASKLIENSHHHNVDRQVSREVNAKIASLRAHNPGDDGTLIEAFMEDEMDAAVKRLNSGKAQGPDRIAPEFINCGTLMLAWLGEFFSHCMSTLRLTKIWHRADVNAILKPNKPADDAKNSCPISLLCVPLKLLKRLLLT